MFNNIFILVTPNFSTVELYGTTTLSNKANCCSMGRLKSFILLIILNIDFSVCSTKCSWLYFANNTIHRFLCLLYKILFGFIKRSTPGKYGTQIFDFIHNVNNFIVIVVSCKIISIVLTSCIKDYINLKDNWDANSVFL